MPHQNKLRVRNALYRLTDIMLSWHSPKSKVKIFKRLLNSTNRPDKQLVYVQMLLRQKDLQADPYVQEILKQFQTRKNP